MALRRAIASYWSGSAWVDIVHAGTTDNAVISIEYEDIIVSPSILNLRISNKSDNPLSGNASTAKGQFTTIFASTDFMPIRVRDSESSLVFFYGVVYDVKEVWDVAMGMVLEVLCYDYSVELRENNTTGATGYKIDTTQNLYTHVANLASSQRDEDSKLWSQAVGGRSSLIKSLLEAFSKNVTFPYKGTNNNTSASVDARWIDSVAAFENNDYYRLDGRNQKSILSHILSLAQVDPHVATTAAQEYGYDFYVDPNFTSTATDHQPLAFFNYFKRGTRPHTDPETNGAKIHLSNASFTEDGRTFPMQGFEFERPRSEIYTDAVVNFSFAETAENGTTSVVNKNLRMEVLKIKAASNHLSTSVPRWKGKPIASGAKGFNEDDGTNLPEWMQVKLAGDGTYNTGGTLTTIARIQYISNTSNYAAITNSVPAYILVSDIDESIDSSAWGEDVLWYGKTNTSATITLKSRPKATYGLTKTLHLTSAATDKPQTIRQQVASRLMRSSNQIIRGSFTTYARPQYSFDDSPASVTTHSGSDQTLDLSGSINPKTKGVRVGMPVVKLVSGQIPNTGIQYGYVASMTDTTVRLTWNTSTVSSSDTVRYFVPIRAGDIVHLKNDLVNVNGKFLVTKVSYTEQPGIFSTRYEVVGAETNEEGGYNRKGFASSLAESVAQQPNLPFSKPNSQAGYGEVNITCEFSSSTTNAVAWTSGTLNIASDSYGINSGTTNSGTSMRTVAQGNLGQSGNTLAADTDYYIYYPGTGGDLRVIQKNNYKYVLSGLKSDGTSTGVTDEADPIVIAHCKAGAIHAGFTVLVQEFSIMQKGDASKKIAPLSLTALLQRKGIQPWSTSAVFTGTGYNSFSWGTSAVSFGDDETEVINSGSRTMGAALEYLYKVVGASPNDAVLKPTVTYSDVYNDDAILLATIVRATDNGAASPTILPFNGNQATISAGVISAGAILAGNIKAGEITTSLINFDAGDIGGNTDNTASIRAVAAATSGTVAGLQVNASKLFIGTGTYNNANTAFYVDNQGNLSLKDKLAWNGTTLTVDGSIVIGSTAGSVIESRANSANQDSTGDIRAGTTAGNVGLGSVENKDSEDQVKYGLHADPAITQGGLTISGGGRIRSGTKTYGADEAGFFLGYDTGTADGSPANQYKFDIGSNTNHLRWSGSGLSVKGTITLSDGTAEAAIKNVNTTQGDVGLGNVPNYSAGTMMGQNHTGNLNSYNFYQSSGARIQMSTSGIIGYTTGSTKSFELNARPDLTPFRVFGTYAGESSGNSQTVTDPNRGIEFLSTISGTTYLASISGTGIASQLRYDASNHSFMNFHQSGYLQDIYYLTMDSSESSDVRIDAGDNALFIFNDADITSSIHLHAEGTTADVDIFSDDGRVKLHASAESTDDTYDPVEIAHAGATIAEFRRQKSYGVDYPHIEMYGHIIPSSDSGFDIGYDTNLRFRTGWFDTVHGADLVLNNTTAGEPNSIDGTRGHWVIQEGADSLYIKNELTGKKYRFKLEEV